MPANLTADALLYLWTTPGTADLGYVTPEEFGHRIGATKDLPENIRHILVGQSSADRIQALVIRKHRLAVDQAQTVARTLGRVLRGEESPANFRSLLTKEIEATPDVVDDIIQVLTAEFITPNYFQINQVYEKRRKDIGRSTPTPTVSLKPSPPVLGHIVDLRNGTIPSRLPPSPPLAPNGSKAFPPRPPTTAAPPPTPISPAPVSTTPAFLPTPKPPIPALPALAKLPSPEPAKDSVPPSARLPARRIQGTPLHQITPRDRPPTETPPPAPRLVPRSSESEVGSPDEGGVGFVRPPGGGAHGPLPPPK